MPVPLLHRQLQTQLSQWIYPKDQRHLQVFSENVGAILQAQSACLSQWLPYLSLIEVCVCWGGRSIPLGQVVLEHGSASVAYADYCRVLETTLQLLPPGCQVTLLADRGFEHGELIRWLRKHQWLWAIRAKSDLKINLANGQIIDVAHLLPPLEETYLFRDVTILQDIECHLATANLAMAGEPWAVLTNIPPSVQTFAIYGQRFGGIEPHFKDYKSAAFDLIRSHLRNPQALNCLLMLLAAATLIAIVIAVVVVSQGRRQTLDWHSQRGLSFLQLGLREIQRLCYQRLPLPNLAPLPRRNPPPASASIKKRQQLETRIEFSRVTLFST